MSALFQSAGGVVGGMGVDAASGKSWSDYFKKEKSKVDVPQADLKGLGSKRGYFSRRGYSSGSGVGDWN
jgi:hypothetical protein